MFQLFKWFYSSEQSFPSFYSKNFGKKMENLGLFSDNWVIPLVFSWAFHCVSTIHTGNPFTAIKHNWTLGPPLTDLPRLHENPPYDSWAVHIPYSFFFFLVLYLHLKKNLPRHFLLSACVSVFVDVACRPVLIRDHKLLRDCTGMSHGRKWFGQNAQCCNSWSHHGDQKH